MRTPGLRMPFGSSALLGRPQRVGEQLGALAVVAAGRCMRPTAWWWVTVPPAARHDLVGG